MDLTGLGLTSELVGLTEFSYELGGSYNHFGTKINYHKIERNKR